MFRLLETREHIYNFVARYEIYVMAAVRFAIAFAAFKLININIGFMDTLKAYPIALIFALICSFLPAGMMLFLGAVMILLHLYALSPELCAIAACLFIILFCLYLRFSERKGLYTVLTPVLGAVGIPYVMPVASGLFDRMYASISVICGGIIYFFLKNVKENAALFVSDDELGTNSVITFAVKQIFLDKEMYLYLAAFAAAAIVANCVKKLKMNHARSIAIVISVIVEMGTVCLGEIYFGNVRSIIKVIIMCVISCCIMLFIDYMTTSLDYSRVEHEQFEDDEYYYYVKAIPKAYVSAEEKQVKKINSKSENNKKREATKGKKVKSIEINDDAGK